MLQLTGERTGDSILAHVLDGFDTAEIAMIQDCDEREIVADSCL